MVGSVPVDDGNQAEMAVPAQSRYKLKVDLDDHDEGVKKLTGVWSVREYAKREKMEQPKDEDGEEWHRSRRSEERELKRVGETEQNRARYVGSGRNVLSYCCLGPSLAL